MLGLGDETVQLLNNLSGLSGYLSISFWLFAQLPQVIKNHNDKSVEGFSLGFLLCWFAGDFLNLVSCVLNNAMMFQILLSGYYCTIDIILAFQYYYYKNMYHNAESRWYHKPKKRHSKHIKSPRTSLRDNLETYGSIDFEISSVKEPNHSGPIPTPHDYKKSPKVKGIFRKKNQNNISKFVTTALISSFSKVEGIPIGHVGKEKQNNSIIHKIVTFFMTINKIKTGKLLAWTCTLLYLISRIPQIITNYKLRSTKGVSIKLIIFALFGNLFYSMSLLLCESSIIGGDKSKDFWESELSYFLGAIGTVLFDFVVVLQWYIYDIRGRYIRTKSGKLKFISPKMETNSVLCNSLDNKDKIKSIQIAHNPHHQHQHPHHHHQHHYHTYTKRSDPIEMSASVKSTLSPNHIKKISESTPLSPMDFLLDDFMSHKNTTIGSIISSSQLGRKKKSANPSIHTVLNAKKHDEDLNMSMDEDEE